MSCLTLSFLPSLALSLLHHSFFFLFFYLAKRKIFKQYKHVKIQNSLHFSFLFSLSFVSIIHIRQFLMHSLIFFFLFSLNAKYFNEIFNIKNGKLVERNEKKNRWIRDNAIPLIFPSFFVGRKKSSLTLTR